MLRVLGALDMRKDDAVDARVENTLRPILRFDTAVANGWDARDDGVLVEEALPVNEICPLEHELHVDLHARNVEGAALHRVEDEVGFGRDDLHGARRCLLPGKNTEDRLPRIEKSDDLVEPLFLCQSTRAPHKDDHASETNRTPKHVFHNGGDYQYRTAQSNSAQDGPRTRAELNYAR